VLEVPRLSGQGAGLDQRGSPGADSALNDWTNRSLITRWPGAS
jgi:hypothetical protein